MPFIRPIASGGAAFDPNAIEQSAWFDGSNDYLSLTFGADGGDTWSLSCFVRLIGSSGEHTIFSRVTNNAGLQWDASTGKFEVNDDGAAIYSTTAVFRDSGWYHILFTGNGTLNKLYVNGDLQALSGSPNIAQLNTADAHRIGSDGGSTRRFKGEISQICWVSGSELSPSDFIGTWTIDAASWTYPLHDADIEALASAAGGNSFALTSAIGDGTDASGNGNNFTPTSMSHAANGSDDTPSNVYSELNKLSSSQTISEGGKLWTDSGQFGGSNATAFTTQLIEPNTGKWYCELEVVAAGASNTLKFGLSTWNQTPQTTSINLGGYAGSIDYRAQGTKDVDGVNSSYGATYTTNDIIGMLVDTDADQITFYKNNSSQGVISWTIPSEGCVVALGMVDTLGASARLLTEESDWTYSAPSGAVALSSANLPTPTIPSSPDTGSFTGNASTNGPVVYLGYSPSASDALTINSNSVTWGTHVLRLSYGFKVISSSASYNASGSNSYSMVTTNAAAGGGDYPPVPGQSD